MDSPPAIICEAPRVTDGDTIRCRNLPESVRLIGIDAPEMTPCPRTRTCTKGSGPAAKAALVALLRAKTVTVELHGRDKYGRNLGHVWAGRLHAGCSLVARRFAVLRYGGLACDGPRPRY